MLLQHFILLLGDCGLPPAIKSGTVVVKLTTQSQVADYSCDNGFTIDRNESLVCDSNGKWVGTIPICSKAVNVELLVDYFNLFVICDPLS